MNIKSALDKEGYAFLVIEEQMWLELLNELMKKTKGNVTKGAEILGISKTTLEKRCRMYGFNVNQFRDKSLRERHDMRERRDCIKTEIKRAFKHCDTITSASKFLGWKRTTLQSRMTALGIDKSTYSKWKEKK